jgi:hypothetical protein
MASKAEGRSTRGDRSASRPHHTIVSLEVTDGFLGGLQVELADGLNCFIGGRGTGKTTALEFVRYVLGLMPDPKVSPTRAKSLEALVKTNLAGGRVRVVVQTKDGARYTAERSWNEAPTVLDEKGNTVSISLDRDLVFKADVFSLNEIEEIATTPALQLALLDRFVDERVRGLNAEVRKLRRDLEENASELVRLERETGELGEVAADAAIFEEKLKVLQAQGGADAQRINQAHAHKALRERESRTLDTLREDAKKISSEIESSAAGFVRRLETRIEKDYLEGPNGDFFRDLSERVHASASALASALEKAKEEARTIEVTLAERLRALGRAHTKQESGYRDLVTRSEEERERATERNTLQARHLEATTARSELEVKRKEREACEARRRELVTRLNTAREARYRLRKETADALTAKLKPMIRVSLKQTESKDAFRELLIEALKGAGIRHVPVAERIADTIVPDELAFLVRRDEPTPLAERAGIDKDRARKVIDSLRGTSRLYEMEILPVEDLPRIELLDGSDYKDSAQLSTGQRCTTILPILLLESERPLLVDQPEDNLDNAFIFETVVKILRATKRGRQLIFVTHNPNIPVLGDAERVFVLSSNGRRGSVSRAGTVDELKEQIVTLLEGGREAFLERKKRYER